MEFDSLRWRGRMPALATALTLVLGLGAIEAARMGNIDLGVRLVLLAILSDGIDGALARRWGVSSSFGGHLDSLCDLIAFGVAPGLLFAAQHPEAPGPLRMAIIAMVAVSGACRLARFQSEPSQRDFLGLPITVGGPLFALSVAGATPADPAGALAWAVALSALMVSRVPFARFNTGLLGQIAPLLGAAFVIALAMDGKFALAAAQATLVGYIVWALARAAGTVAVGGRPAAGGRGRGE